jgi:hypothetical protein
MRRPAGCNSGGCGENPGRRTDKERRTGMVGTGRMHRLIPGHGNDSDTEGTLREELTREPFLAVAGVH